MSGPIENFAERLLVGTNNGTIKWEITNNPNVLVLEGRSGDVKLKRIAEDTIKLEIFNDDGDLVGTTGSDPNRPGAWQSWEIALRELFPIAVLQARGTTDVIQNLEKELGLIEPEDPGIPF